MGSIPILHLTVEIAQLVEQQPGVSHFPALTYSHLSPFFRLIMMIATFAFLLGVLFAGGLILYIVDRNP